MNETLNRELSSRWSDMIKESTLLDFKVGQVIFYEGHVPYGVFVFVSGKISLSTRYDDEIKEAPLNVPIGVEAFFDQVPYQYTATAETPVKAYFVGNSVIRKYSVMQIDV